VIVNRKLAEQVWPGQDPLGKRMHLGAPESPLPWIRVVGEIADVKQGSAGEETLPQLYQPVSQTRASAGSFADPDPDSEAVSGTIVMRADWSRRRWWPRGGRLCTRSIRCCLSRAWSRWSALSKEDKLRGNSTRS